MFEFDEGDDYVSLVDMLRRVRESQREYWWRPEGRGSIRRHTAGAELRNVYAIGGREIEDVPLPP
jgi:hypothetical protein